MRANGPDTAALKNPWTSRFTAATAKAAELGPDTMKSSNAMDAKAMVCRSLVSEGLPAISSETDTARVLDAALANACVVPGSGLTNVSFVLHVAAPAP